MGSLEPPEHIPKSTLCALLLQAGESPLCACLPSYTFSDITLVASVGQGGSIYTTVISATNKEFYYFFSRITLPACYRADPCRSNSYFDSTIGN